MSYCFIPNVIMFNAPPPQCQSLSPNSPVMLHGIQNHEEYTTSSLLPLFAYFGSVTTPSYSLLLI
jgi:hypothetical protein